MVSFSPRFLPLRKLKPHRPLLVAISMVIIVQLGFGLYLSALPQIASFYSTRESAVVATLYAYLCCHGTAQILFAISYVKLGFRKSINIGFILFCLGTLALIFSPDLCFFTLSRGIQGFGGGILVVMARILVKDQYQGDELNVAFSYLGMFTAITPVFAPFLGAVLIHHYSWKHLFILLLALGVFVFFSVYYLSVALVSVAGLPISKGFKDYALILKSKRYVFLLLARFLVFIPVLIFLSGSSFLFINSFGTSTSVYGYLMVLAAGGIFMGCILSARRAAFRRVRPGWYLISSAAISMLLAYLVTTRAHALSFSLSVASIVLVALSFGLLFPNLTAAIVKLKLARSGADIALAGAVQLIGASLINFAITQVHFDWQLTMGVLFLFVAIALLVILKEHRIGQIP